MPRTIKIVFAGAYGIENAGDDIPLINICKGLREHYPNIDFQFSALSRHPNRWEEENYSVKMLQNLEHQNSELAQNRWFQGCNPGDAPHYLDTVREEIRKADLLILGAGNALIDLTIDFLRGPVPLMFLYGLFAQLYETPFMIFGMSVGPLTSSWGIDLSSSLLKMAKLVTVRDHESEKTCRDLLKFNGMIHVIPDPALLAVSPSEDKALALLSSENITIPDLPVIAMGLRDLSRPFGLKMSKSIEDALCGVLETRHNDCYFLFVPHSTYLYDDDRLFAQKLIKRFRPKYHGIIQTRHNPLDLISFYRLASITCSIRLHSAVFGAISGTPIVAINYLPKVSGFMEKIDLKSNCVDLDSITYSQINQRINTTLKYSAVIKDKLDKTVLTLRKEANEYIRLIGDILKIS